MGDIVELPTKPRRSPRQIARAYMMGELDIEDYPKQGGLLKRLLAADMQTGMAQDAALKAIEALADLGHEHDTVQVIDLKLVEIENREGRIVEVGA